MKTMTQLFLASALVVALLSLSGCNTWNGLGEDISAMGDKMQKKSD